MTKPTIPTAQRVSPWTRTKWAPLRTLPDDLEAIKQALIARPRAKPTDR